MAEDALPPPIDDLVLRHVGQLVIDGRLSFCANAVSIARLDREGDLSGILLAQQNDVTSLFSNLTSEGARQIAAKLIQAADRRDAEAGEFVRSRIQKGRS